MSAVPDRHRNGRGPHAEVIAVTRVADIPSRRLLDAVGLREAERCGRWGADQVLCGGRGRPRVGRVSHS
ncbi:hypothetical protein ACF05R_09230 [Streptomyces albidoflavus]